MRFSNAPTRAGIASMIGFYRDEHLCSGTTRALEIIDRGASNLDLAKARHARRPPQFPRLRALLTRNGQRALEIGFRLSVSVLHPSDVRLTLLEIAVANKLAGKSAVIEDEVA
jgi:hypothetical protein